jgi:putative transposase
MVNSPQHYPWSSYRHNALGQRDSLLEMHSVFRRLGPDEAKRHDVYRTLFHDALAPEDLKQIRLATKAGTVIGNDRFREQIEKVLECRIQPLGHGGDRKSKGFRDQQL